MKHFTKFATAAVLAASLAPFAAQARSDGFAASNAPQHLVGIASTQAANAQQHGRIAENAKVPANFTTAPGAIQYANTDHDNGFAG